MSTISQVRSLSSMSVIAVSDGYSNAAMLRCLDIMNTAMSKPLRQSSLSPAMIANRFRFDNRLSALS